ncbi:protease modulator HflC [bacterium]|nr:protease modulator HflC [bacterium]MBU1652664.1 protease modulator HflC [bacterium]MBU1881876.1 protease modulator HflC [bacterium]
MKRFSAYLIGGIVVVLILSSVFYQLWESQVAVITQFGKPIKTITEPGLHAKLPFPFQRVQKLDSRLLTFDPPSAEFLTEDKKNLIVDAFMLWQISDPVKFLVSVKDRSGAEARLSDLLYSSVGRNIGHAPFAALISTKDQEQKLDEICAAIRENCSQAALENFGIEVKSALIKRLAYPAQNRVAVFERMKAERGRIARQYRSEGEESAQKIRSNADLEAALVLADAQQKAIIIAGEGEAQAANIYRQAIQQDPQFYKYLRSLDAYGKFLNDKTTIVLPNDSELLQVLREGIP